MISPSLLLSLAVSAAPPTPPAHLLAPSPAARALGLTVVLTYADGRRVHLLGADRRALARLVAGKGPALYVPFDGQPATSITTAHARRERPWSLGMDGCEGVPNMSVPVASAKGLGLAVIGATAEHVRWLPAEPAPVGPDGAQVLPRRAVRIRGLDRPCVTVGDGGPPDDGRPGNVTVRLRAETAGACAEASDGAPDQTVPWWSDDDDTSVTDVYGVLELNGGAERWLLIESGYVEASGPVAIPLTGELPTGAAHVACGGVVVWIGAQTD